MKRASIIVDRRGITTVMNNIQFIGSRKLKVFTSEVYWKTCYLLSEKRYISENNKEERVSIEEDSRGRTSERNTSQFIENRKVHNKKVFYRKDG